MAFNLLQRNLWNSSMRCSHTPNDWKQTALKFLTSKRWWFSDMNFNRRGKAYADFFMSQKTLHPLYEGFLRIRIYWNWKRIALHWRGSWGVEVGGNLSMMIWRCVLLQKWCLERGDKQPQMRKTMDPRALGSVQVPSSPTPCRPCCPCVNLVVYQNSPKNSPARRKTNGIWSQQPPPTTTSTLNNKEHRLHIGNPLKQTSSSAPLVLNPLWRQSTTKLKQWRKQNAQAWDKLPLYLTVMAST